MATFPSYVLIAWKDAGEQPTPVVSRSDMERGIAKQRRIAADSVVTLPVTLGFRTAADAAAFEAWVYQDVDGGAAWFDFPLLRTGTVVSARIVGGDIGMLKPSTSTWARTQRSMKLEYVRSTL